MTLDETIKMYEAKNDQEFRQFIRYGAGGEATAGPKQTLASLKLNPSEMASLSRSLRALSGTNLPSGGATVSQSFVNKLTAAIRYYSAVADACTILPTPTGVTMPWPSILDVGNLGETSGENSALTVTSPSTTPADPLFGEISLGAVMLDSGIVPVSLQLIQDAFDGFEDRLVAVLGQRIGRKLNPLLTTNGSSSTPQGIVAASIQGALAASASTVTHDDLMALIFSLDCGYRETASFQMNDATLQVISTLRDSSQRPLWIASTTGTKNSRIKGTVLGYPVTVNRDMANIGASATSVLFGAMENYICRMAGPPQIFRYEENYMPNFQIGYCIFQRVDGKLQDAGSHPIQALVHPGS